MALIGRLGGLLNPHVHFRCLVSKGLFSLDARVRVVGADRPDLERLLR
ncbi:MAG: hypothetical protein RKP46_01025 [Candidatus Accumulibacter sp.]|nr:hypothetical protein [Accumulibacter sp.]MDS4012917.1 hypothetical protein [Accumulibacter sp.]